MSRDFPVHCLFTRRKPSRHPDLGLDVEAVIEMPARTAPLLCELHTHTTWSDGALTMRELVDLYGSLGFDVLAVTDHSCRADDPWIAPEDRAPRGVHAGNYADYLGELDDEAARALDRYDMLLLPGLELTWNDLDAFRAAHALALGIRTFVPLDDGFEAALATAREAGAAIVAAHPFADEADQSAARTTRRFAHDRERLAPLVDRYELFNRTRLFAWVEEARLPFVATGDFHQTEHLAGWKTLMPCAKDTATLIGYLRSELPVYLTRFDVDEKVAA
jgi:predicted metal-dependent phosphoesterase TrpH